jgi:SAM-dependent methyltransferase
MNATSVTSQKATVGSNSMSPIRWVPSQTSSLLDIGCNAGELLSDCRELYPAMRLSGIEINRVALDSARQTLPDAHLCMAGADNLPFADASFDCVTCVEVLEHIPAGLRKQSLGEMRRVLRTGGRLILRVPHAGMFAFLDSNNLRFRMPRLYSTLLKEGRRDAGYPRGSADVVWHHHFTREELHELLGDGWQLESSRTGGLFLLPVSDIALWPFYRLQRTNNVLYRTLQRISAFDIGCDYGKASFDILLVLRRT